MKRYLFPALAVAGLFTGSGPFFTNAADDHSREKNLEGGMKES
jgi:hypothetical protein